MARRFVYSFGATLLALILASAATAQTEVTLSLDIYYADGNFDGLVDTTAVGTFQLLSTADAASEGLAGLDASVSGLSGTFDGTTLEFWANEGLSPAAEYYKEMFDVSGTPKPWYTDQDGDSNTLDMLFGQVPVDSPGPQVLSYGVGTPGNLANPDELVGIDASGSTMTDAVMLAFGSFTSASGVTINTSSNRSGANVFSVQGTASDPPAEDTILAASPFNVQTRSNAGAYSGDVTLDGAVDFTDVGDFSLGFLAAQSAPSVPRIWQEGEVTGDRVIDFSDVGSFSIGFVAFNSPAVAADHIDPGTPGAIAEYDPVTGNICITANDVHNYQINSASNSLTGAEPVGFTQNLTVNTDAALGEGDLFNAFSAHLDLGPVAAAGLDLSDLSLQWQEGGLSSPSITVHEGEVILKGGDPVVPEPTTLALAALGLCGVMASRRRRIA